MYWTRVGEEYTYCERHVSFWLPAALIIDESKNIAFSGPSLLFHSYSLLSSFDVHLSFFSRLAKHKCYVSNDVGCLTAWEEGPFFVFSSRLAFRYMLPRVLRGVILSRMYLMIYDEVLLVVCAMLSLEEILIPGGVKPKCAYLSGWKATRKQKGRREKLRREISAKALLTDFPLLSF